MKQKKNTPIKSAVIVKFSTKTGAYRFKSMLNSMLKHGDLPFSLDLH